MSWSRIQCLLCELEDKNSGRKIGCSLNRIPGSREMHDLVHDYWLHRKI